MTPPSAKFVTAAQTHIRQTVNGFAANTPFLNAALFCVVLRSGVATTSFFFQIRQIRLKGCFHNTQDIEVKVQYILHEDRQQGTFHTTQGPLFTSAEK